VQCFKQFGLIKRSVGESNGPFGGCSLNHQHGRKMSYVGSIGDTANTNFEW